MCVFYFTFFFSIFWLINGSVAHYHRIETAQKSVSDCFASSAKTILIEAQTVAASITVVTHHLTELNRAHTNRITILSIHIISRLLVWYARSLHTMVMVEQRNRCRQMCLSNTIKIHDSCIIVWVDARFFHGNTLRSFTQVMQTRLYLVCLYDYGSSGISFKIICLHE